jgi:hypothetical protein
LTGVGSQLFTQDSPGVPDSAEEFDQFGHGLAAGAFNDDSFVDLAVGVPGETVGSFQFAGAINVLPGSARGLTGTRSQLFTQNSPGCRGPSSSTISSVSRLPLPAHRTQLNRRSAAACRHMILLDLL